MPAAMTEEKERCNLVWQITGKCNRSCRYCLRQRADKPKSELGAPECREILELYLEFAKARGFEASINFSGGNPLLREDLPELLLRVKKAREDGVVGAISFLANPETLDERLVEFLAECGTKRFALSLDGGKDAMDSMRGPGSHAAAVKAIPMLVKAGIKVFVKYTVTKLNRLEAGESVDLALDLGADSIGFGELSQPNAGPDVSDLELSPMDYREYLLRLLMRIPAMKEERRIFVERAMRFGDGLSALLHFELGRMDEFKERLRSFPDPGRGRPSRERWNKILFVVWENGEVHPCNPEPCVGHAPKESFEAIFSRLGRERLQFERRRLFRKEEQELLRPKACLECPVLKLCKTPSKRCWRLASAEKETEAKAG